MKQKNSYAQPNLVAYGTVRNLTGGSQLGTNDSGGNNNGGKTTGPRNN